MKTDESELQSVSEHLCWAVVNNGKCTLPYRKVARFKHVKWISSFRSALLIFENFLSHYGIFAFAYVCQKDELAISKPIRAWWLMGEAHIRNQVWFTLWPQKSIAFKGVLGNEIYPAVYMGISFPSINSFKFEGGARSCANFQGSSLTHLNRDQIESNLNVPGIQGCHENALYKSCEMSPHFISVSRQAPTSP